MPKRMFRLYLLLLLFLLVLSSNDTAGAGLLLPLGALAARRSAQDLWKERVYPELPLSSEAQEVLSWRESTASVTPSGESATEDVHYEILRAVNRLSNLGLLLDGDDTAYGKFTRTQKNPITRAQFDFFVKQMRKLDPSARKALEALTVTSAVPFAPDVIARADAANCGALPFDSVAFLEKTLSDCPEIYPVYSALDTKAKALAQKAFLFGHVRHMLYAEGREEMFVKFLAACEQIPDPKERIELFDLWWAQWFINISGFKVETDVTKDPHGSLYLHRGNAESLIQLYQRLQAAVIDPSRILEILPGYLDFRATELGMVGEGRAFKTQIAAWLRIYSKDHPLLPVLDEVVEGMPDLRDLKMPMAKTPTYGPALFENAISLRSDDPRLALTRALSIYTQAYSEYQKRVALNHSADIQPLSFRIVADKKNLEKVMEYPSFRIELDSENNVLVCSDTPQPSPRTFADRPLTPRRYNFVLVPEGGGDDFVRLSQEKCTAYAPEYILNRENSLPHMSVCQIETDRPDSELQEILREVLAKGEISILVNFNPEIVVKAGSGAFDHVNWIELVPDEASSPALHEIHAKVLEAVQAKGFVCKNKHGKEYQPHATLGNVSKKSDFAPGEALPEGIMARFRLVFGLADQHWQFNRVLASDEALSSHPVG